MRTPAGVSFALMGRKGASPAPTIFVFATEKEDSLTNPVYLKLINPLFRKGFLCVSLDLPCHGDEQKPGEPYGLDGWRARLERDGSFIPSFVGKVSNVLDFLIHEGYTDPKRIVASGASRGGFAAMHFAAVDPRVSYIVVFCPVTNLLGLHEFASMRSDKLTQALSLMNAAEQLVDRWVWLCIGNNDARVGTLHFMRFALRLMQAAADQGKPARVELHVTGSPGHRVHASAYEEAANWILAQLGEEVRQPPVVLRRRVDSPG